MVEMTSAMESSAWSVLSQAWMWRWFCILGVGALPTVARFLAPGRLTPGAFFEVKRVCATMALLLTLFSGKLLVDTYRLESQDSSVLAHASCQVSRPPMSAVLPLQCADGEYYWVPLSLAMPSAPTVKLTYLSFSRLVIRIEAS